MRPLWADRTHEERLPWLHEADVFLRMAAECGVSVTTTEAMFGLMTAIEVRAPERFEVTAAVPAVPAVHGSVHGAHQSTPAEDRAREIAEGRDRPGPEGAYYRLMALMDHQEISRWVEAEKRLGLIEPGELFNIVSQVIAGTVVQAVGHTVMAFQARQAAREIMSAAVPMIEEDVAALVERAKKRNQNVVRMPTRLRTVKS